MSRLVIRRGIHPADRYAGIPGVHPSLGQTVIGQPYAAAEHERIDEEKYIGGRYLALIVRHPHIVQREHNHRTDAKTARLVDQVQGDLILAEEGLAAGLLAD